MGFVFLILTSRCRASRSAIHLPAGLRDVPRGAGGGQQLCVQPGQVAVAGARRVLPEPAHGEPRPLSTLTAQMQLACDHGHADAARGSRLACIAVDLQLVLCRAGTASCAARQNLVYASVFSSRFCCMAMHGLCGPVLLLAAGPE